ncbi:MAG: nucleoside recognition domain-containing protein [Vicinamibacterales bacterium]
MSCSARLPVYVLLTSLLFAGQPSAAAAAFAGCYALGAASALLTAKLFSRTILQGRPRPMILELPSYKRPSLRNALLEAKDQGLAFLITAGTAIIAICVVMWWLSAYPKTGAPASANQLRAAAATAVSTERRDALLGEADLLQARAAQSNSFAGRIGRGIAPVFKPLGFDWQLTVGVMTSFLAREVFVSTMAVLAGSRDEGDVSAGVIGRIGSMTRDDGTPVFTPSTAASALVFFVLAMQCLPTLTVTRRETGSVKYAAIQLVYMSGLAYLTSLLVYAGLRGAGLS